MRAMVIAVVMALSLAFHVGLTMPSKKVHKMSARVQQMGEDTGQAIKKGGKEVR